MFRLPRASGLFLLATLLLTLPPRSIGPTVHGFQLKDVLVDGLGGGDTIKPTDPVTLPLDRSAKRKLATVRDYVQEESWPEAIRLIQAILDAPEDGFLPRSALAKRPGDPSAGPRWISARAEAERLLAELPARGLEFYQLTYEATARKLLTAAQTRQDVPALGEVVRRFALTKAGGEALAYLGTYHLDRGRTDLAAGCFQRLLTRPGADNLSPLILFQAALAFHAVGDAPGEAKAWGLLTRRLGSEGLRVGGKVISLDGLRKEIDRWSKAAGRRDDWPLFRGDARRAASGFGEAPLLKARQRISTVRGREAREMLEQAERTVFPGSVTLPASVPIVVGGRLVFRTQDGLRALDLQTGKELWQARSPLALERLLADLGSKVQLEAWLPHYANARSLLYENAALGTLSSDGRQVYAVDDLPVPPPPELVMRKEQGRPFPFGPLKGFIGNNRLRAFDAETGALLWEVGGQAPAAQGELADAIFLGPPLPLGGLLYALTEKDQDVRLVCLHPEKGEVQWWQTLATARDKIELDVNRRVQAAPLAFGEGVLVCPTNTGAILGVDPLTRSLLWAHTYRTKSPAASEMGLPVFTPLGFAFGWKAAAPIIQDGKVIFTACDGDSLRCLNLRDGSLLWKVTRTEDDLYLAGVFDGRILVVGKDACRAYALADGKLLWQIRTGLPSGQGIASGKYYYLPLQPDPSKEAMPSEGSKKTADRARSGAVLALNLENPGDSVRISFRETETLGNLLFHEGTLWSQGITSLTAYQQLKTGLAAADAALAKAPNDAAARRERGRLRLDQGDLAGAVADLRAARADRPSPEVDADLFTALTRLLERDFHAGEKYLDEYRTLCQRPVPPGAREVRRRQLEEESRRRLTHCLALVARGRQAQGRLDEALKAYRDLLAIAKRSDLLPVPYEPGLQSRPDLWVQGQVAAFVQRATAEQRKQLEKCLEQEWRSIQSRDKVEALQRFLALYGALADSRIREARLRLAELLADAPNPRHALEAEMHLLALAGPEHRGPLPNARTEKRQSSSSSVHPPFSILDPPSSLFAARILQTQARLLTRNGLLADAAERYVRLGRDQASVRLPGGETGAELLKKIKEDPRFLPYLEKRSDPWEGARIKAIEILGTFPQGTSFAFGEPQEPLPPSLRDYRLVIDLQEARFRVLHRDTGAEMWSTEVTPSHGRGPLFNVVPPNFPLPFRVVGHLAIFEVGPEVVGLDLIERRVRWNRRVQEEGAVPMSIPIYTPDGNVGFMGDWSASVDQGPVGPECLCVRTRGGLSVLDPATGEVRWTRTDVPLALEVFGDAEHLFLAERNLDGTVRGVRALRVRDGVVEAIPDCAELYAHKLRTLGRNLLTSEEGPNGERILRHYDVRTGQDLWKATFPAQSIVLDSPTRELIGVVTPDGDVMVRDLLAGRELLRAKVERKHLDQVTGGRLLADRKQFYVAFLGPNQGLVPCMIGMGMPNDNVIAGSRSVSINGFLYAFDRVSGELRWYSRVPWQTILLDRFEDLPLILCNALMVRQGLPPTGNYQVIATRSLDKRTGKIVYNREIVQANDQFHTYQVNLRTGTIDLIATGVKIRHALSR
jgi:outer membrane protein assembly factor BamB